MRDSDTNKQIETKLFTTQEILRSISQELPEYSWKTKIQVAQYVISIVIRKKVYTAAATHPALRFLTIYFAIVPFVRRTARLVLGIVPAFPLHIGPMDVLEYILVFIFALLMYKAMALGIR